MTTKIEAAHHVLLAMHRAKTSGACRASARWLRHASRRTAKGTAVVVRENAYDRQGAGQGEAERQGDRNRQGEGQGEARQGDEGASCRKGDEVKPAKAKPTAKREPRGKTVKILELAARKGGVTPAESATS